MKFTIAEKGSSLVEVLLAGALLGLLVIALTGMLIYGQESTVLAGKRARASFLAEEGLEAARAIRNNAYSGLANGTYGLSQASGKWIFSGSSDINDIFTRQIAVTDAGTSRKQIISTVTWQQTLQRSGSVILTTYLTNWIKSAGNWALPTLGSSFDLTLANSGDASADTSAIAFAGNKIYLGRASGAGKEFYIIDVSNPDVPVLLGQRDLTGTPADIVINGNYAYIASDDNSSELQIIDISTPSTIANAGKLTTVDLTVANSNNATADAIALAVSGNYLAMVRNGGDEFLLFDLTNPSAPGNPVGRTATLVGNPNDVVISGNYAYVSSEEDNSELQVINITTKTAPSRVAVLDLNSGNANANALSIELAGSYLLIGRSSTAAPDLYAVSIATPTSPVLTSTLDIAGDVRSISYDSSSGYAFLATNDASADFKVIDASNIAAMSIIGSVNLSPTPNKIIYDNTLNRAFLSTSDNTQELEIIKPQ